RPVVGLREAEAADDLAGRHLGEVAPLLLLAAERVDGVHRERALDRRKRAHAGVAALELLHDETVSDVVQPRAAVFLGEVRAKYAERRELGDDLARKPAVDEALPD